MHLILPNLRRSSSVLGLDPGKRAQSPLFHLAALTLLCPKMFAVWGLLWTAQCLSTVTSTKSARLPSITSERCVHSEVRHTRWLDEYRSDCRWLQTWLLQFSAVWCVWSQPEQTAGVQNSLARAALLADTPSSAAQNLTDLHWLPVRARIKYKVALLTFKTLTTQQTHVASRLAPVPDHSKTPVLQRTPFDPRRRSQDRVRQPNFLSHCPNCLELVTAQLDG